MTAIYKLHLYTRKAWKKGRFVKGYDTHGAGRTPRQPGQENNLYIFPDCFSCGVFWVRLTNILIHYCSNPEPEQLVQEKSTTHKEREAGQSKFERNQGMLALRTQMWGFVF